MGAQYKVLGQTVPAASINTTLYTVPSTANTIVSTLAICNPNPIANVGVSIMVIPNGQSLTHKNYITYNMPVPFYDTITLTIGITLAGGDSIQVYANGYSNISFSAFGTEIT